MQEILIWPYCEPLMFNIYVSRGSISIYFQSKVMEIKGAAAIGVLIIKTACRCRELQHLYAIRAI